MQNNLETTKNSPSIPDRFFVWGALIAGTVVWGGFLWFALSPPTEAPVGSSFLPSALVTRMNVGGDSVAKPIAATTPTTDVAPAPDIYARRGQIGDSFGMLNTLLAMLAAIAAYSTYRQQRMATQSQAAAIKDQMDANHANRNAIEYQQFGELVRQAVDAYNGLLNSIEVTETEARSFKGRQALRRLYEEYFSAALAGEEAAAVCASITTEAAKGKDVNKLVENLSDVQLRFLLVEYATTWKKFYQKNTAELDCLFRALYHVYVLLRDAPVAIDSKSIWAANRRFRAQLSAIELQTFLANQIYTESGGFPLARELCNQFAIFDNFSNTQGRIDIAAMREAVSRCSKPGAAPTWVSLGINHTGFALDERAFSSDLARKFIDETKARPPVSIPSLS